MPLQHTAGNGAHIRGAAVVRGAAVIADDEIFVSSQLPPGEIPGYAAHLGGIGYGLIVHIQLTLADFHRIPRQGHQALDEHGVLCQGQGRAELKGFFQRRGYRQITTSPRLYSPFRTTSRISPSCSVFSMLVPSTQTSCTQKEETECFTCNFWLS